MCGSLRVAAAPLSGAGRQSGAVCRVAVDERIRALGSQSFSAALGSRGVVGAG